MKKKYALGIAGVICAMFLSVTYYALKVVQKNNNLESIGDSISYLMTGNFVNSKDTEQEFEYQSQVYNYLMESGSNQKKVALRAVNTTVGYEGLYTEEEKTCYNLIKSNCDKISNTSSRPGIYPIDQITVRKSKLTPYQIKKVLYAVQNDNPDIFWIASSFSYQYMGNNTIVKLNSIMSQNDQKAAIKRLSEKVANILSGVSQNASDYQKELYVHDYITKNCKYSYQKDNPKIYTSYGCLIDKAAVCEGYSKATQLLLNTLGIECSTVTGAKKQEAHMWNIVKINKRWYHLDVTWDGSSKIGNYNYFNLDDKTIRADHTVNEQLSPSAKLSDKRYNFKLPKCSSMAENYYEKNAVKINNLDNNSEKTIVKNLTDKASKKKKYFYLKINSNYDNIRKQLIGQKPYKIFKYFGLVNKTNVKNKINKNKINYTENKAQKVLIVELFY